MSKRYSGGLITKSPITPAGPFETGAASGVWTLEQQMQFKQQGIWPLAGNVPNFIEDVFSTYLYTGNGTTLTITNGIDFSTKGGLLWIKSRNDAFDHFLFDTVRGAGNRIISDSTVGGSAGFGQAFTSTGFQLTDGGSSYNDTVPYVSWSFREQPKFFDVVTWTGTGANTTIAHNLGSVPGCIMVKRTNAASAWAVYHRSLANTQYLVLNTTAAAATGATWWNSTTPTSSVFSVGTDASVNASGGTYVAYIFAHDAGGFGLTGTDNVISCGSYTGNGSATGPVVTLGYEPQWLMIKRVDSTGDWPIFDNMRGIPVTGNTQRLDANGTQDEATISAAYAGVSATGFYLRTSNATFNASGGTYIYIAIRRGPMKVPTSGTSVFSPNVTASQPVTITTPSAPDMAMSFIRGSVNANWNSSVSSRLTGSPVNLVTSSNAAEVTNASTHDFNDNQGFVANVSASSMSWNVFKRAPSFMDVVCYTGTGANTTVSHNLGVAPELMLVKIRSGAGNWAGYSATTGAGFTVQLNSTVAASASATVWNSTSPTASVFSVGTAGTTNGSGSTFVAYLFATCAGVSKVGSYTGNGTTQTIDCGLTAGARFVLIRRTDAAGSWYVYDTARGMTVLTDPYLLLNSTAAEVATLGSVTTVATGFALDSAILAAINVSAGTYIFLAIA